MRTGDFRDFSTYMRPVPIVPTFTRIFIYGSHREPSNIFQHFSNVSNALNALEHVLPTHLTHVKKAEISDNSYVYGRGFTSRCFTEIHRLYAPCPDCPDLCPNIYLRKPSGTFQHFPTFFQRFQRFERIGACSSNAFNALNARLKPPIPRLNAVFGRKTANLQHKMPIPQL